VNFYVVVDEFNCLFRQTGHYFHATYDLALFEPIMNTMDLTDSPIDDEDTTPTTTTFDLSMDEEAMLGQPPTLLLVRNNSARAATAVFAQHHWCSVLGRRSGVKRRIPLLARWSSCLPDRIMTAPMLPSGVNSEEEAAYRTVCLLWANQIAKRPKWTYCTDCQN
jgi:hypothetical protein